MSGTGQTVRSVSATGQSYIDGIMYSQAWSGTITYSFPVLANTYGTTASYGGYDLNPSAVGLEIPNALSFFKSATTSLVDAARYALEGKLPSGVLAANYGFSIEGFTLANIVASTPGTTTLRMGLTEFTNDSYGGVAGLPTTDYRAGDIWLNDDINLTARAGNKAWLNVIHEIGHAMGLKHPTVAAFDGMEHTVMSYHSYVGATQTYGNETLGYAQTYMRSDIAALQRLYGADFTTNQGNTVYKWNPGNGATLVNGVTAINPGANRIFATIWDGNGNDTFDLTAYTTGVQVDLRPGFGSSFSSSQKADLGNGHLASANIYNAYQYNGDARSLIENASTGSGADSLIGNQVRNVLRGMAGNDTLQGLAGNDYLSGGRGNDKLYGGTGADQFQFVQPPSNDSSTGADTVYDFSTSSGDVVYLKGNTSITSWLDLLASHLFQTTLGAQIRVPDGSTMLLAGVNTASLQANDFYFA